MVGDEDLTVDEKGDVEEGKEKGDGGEQEKEGLDEMEKEGGDEKEKKSGDKKVEDEEKNDEEKVEEEKDEEEKDEEDKGGRNSDEEAKTPAKRAKKGTFTICSSEKASCFFFYRAGM